MAFFLRECTVGIVHVDDDIILGARGIAEWLDQPSLVRTGMLRDGIDSSSCILSVLDTESRPSLRTEKIDNTASQFGDQRRGRLFHEHRDREGSSALPRRLCS
jgi:hypothetical protein